MPAVDAPKEVTNSQLDLKLDRVLDTQGDVTTCLHEIKTEQARQDERIKTNTDNIGKNEGEIKGLRTASNRLDVIIVSVSTAITGIGAWFNSK